MRMRIAFSAGALLASTAAFAQPSCCWFGPPDQPSVLKPDRYRLV